MPNLDQAKKALRVADRRRKMNDRWRAKLRAAAKELRLAMAENDKDKAQKSYVTLTGILDRAARRNIIHPNRAARKKSRLAHQISKIS